MFNKKTRNLFWGFEIRQRTTAFVFAPICLGSYIFDSAPMITGRSSVSLMVKKYIINLKKSVLSLVQ